MKSTDVLIAGGGLMGLTTAYYLSRQGLSVRLFDTGEVGREASWAGGGILWPLYAWRYPLPVQNMAQLGRRLYPQLCENLLSETGIDTEYRQSGLLILDADEVEPARQWCSHHREAFDVCRSAAETTLLPDVAQVRNPRLCKALKAAIERAGVYVHEGEAVQELLSDAGSFKGMRTQQGLYSAKIGVVATGAWTSQLLPQAKLFPVKGQMLLLRGEPELLERILLRNGCYAIPRSDGHILVGSSVEHAGFDTNTDTGVAASLRAQFSDYMPALSELPLIHQWSGLRPATDSGIPFVTEIETVSGLYINAGHYRNGVVAAPASAKLLTGLITQQQQELDAKDYLVA